MASLISLEYESRHNITGRGTVFVVDTRKQDYTFRIGDKVVFDDTEYQIRGIEQHMKLMHPPFPGPMIGVLVRPWLPEAQ